MAAGGRAGDEGDAATAEAEEVLGAAEAAVEVVGRGEVVLERPAGAAEVPLEEDDGQPCLAAGEDQGLVAERLLVPHARRHQEDAADARLGRGAAWAEPRGRRRARGVEVEVVRLEPDALVARHGVEPRSGEGEARLEPGARRAPLDQGPSLGRRGRGRAGSSRSGRPSGSAPRRGAPATPATRSRPRRRGGPPPARAGHPRSAPRAVATSASSARATLRYFGSTSADMTPPVSMRPRRFCIAQ